MGWTDPAEEGTNGSGEVQQAEKGGFLQILGDSGLVGSRQLPQVCRRSARSGEAERRVGWVTSSRWCRPSLYRTRRRHCAHP
jgi:hypothetical protein